MAPIFDNSAPLSVPQTSSQALAKPQAQPAKAEAPVAPVEAAKPKSTKPRTLPPLGMSVRFGAKKPPKEKTEEKPTEQVIEKAASYGNLPVQQAELNVVWEAFAKGQGTFVQQTLMLSHPVLKGESTVHVRLENSFQQEKINDVKPELMPYLRAKLKNDSITVEVSVSASLESTKAFTPKEKLEQMMKSNPALVKLVKTLDLQMY